MQRHGAFTAANARVKLTNIAYRLYHKANSLHITYFTITPHDGARQG